MPDRDKDKTSPGGSRNWWNRAKDFMIRDSGMYDMGDNANLNISNNHINANNLVVVERLISIVSQTDRVERAGLLPEPDQQNLQKIPVARDSDGFSGEYLQETLVQGQPASPETNIEILSTPPSDPPGQNNIESEATVEYTEPDVPSDNLMSYYSCAGRARTHIYSLGLLMHRAGYPLYMPTPSRGLPVAYRKKGIRIGDLGRITANGAFDFLFNICCPDSGNPAKLPDDFEFLEPIVRDDDRFAACTCLTSEHVERIDKPVDQSWSPGFQCSADEGAVLVLPKGAILYGAMNRLHFQTHASRCAINWYKYMLNSGRDCPNGSLYLVTDCIKSVNWGISVFYAPPKVNDSLHFIANGDFCYWEPRGKVEARVGPKPQDIFDAEEPNQCVFLQGYKIMLHPDIWNKLRKAVAITSQDRGLSFLSSDRSTSHSPCQGMTSNQNGSFPQRNASCISTATQDSLTSVSSRPEISTGHELHFEEVILEEDFNEETPLHPSDLINTLLLYLRPEATVSLVHDSEWCDNLPEDFISDPMNPNVDGLLENIKQSYKVAVDENGSAILIHNHQDEMVNQQVEVMDRAKAMHESEDPSTLTSMADLPSTYWTQGRLNEAEKLNVEVTEERKEQLGSHHTDTLTSMAKSLASTYWKQGRWDEAEKLNIQVMEARKEKLGSHHPDTLTSMADLASTYWKQGRWDEAEKLNIQVMEARKEKLGSHHPDTLTSMADLASTYWKQGRWDEAEKLNLQVMEARKEKLGSHHPDTLTSMANLASTYWKQGRWDEAEKLNLQVMEARREKLGSHHPDTLTNMANLASIYWKQGRLDEAEKLNIEVMKARKERLGSHHPDTLTSMANLASTYWKQGRLDEAERLNIQVMEAGKEGLGSHHPDTLSSMANLASTYWKQGRWDEAEKLNIQVMEARKEKLGSHHPDTLTSMANLASVYWNQGKLDEAGRLDEQIMEARKEKLGLHHPDTLTSMENLASTYWKQGRLDDAEWLNIQVTEARKEKYGLAHPETLTSIINPVSTYNSQVKQDNLRKAKLQISSRHSLQPSLGSTYKKQGM